MYEGIHFGWLPDRALGTMIAGEQMVKREKNPLTYRYATTGKTELAQGKGVYIYIYSRYICICFYRYIYTATWRCHRYTPTCISRRCPREMTEGRGPKERENK